MATEITLDYLIKKKCPICGDSHKSFSSIMHGQVHISTVTVCCNCGFTMTFSHSASEYARYIESGQYEPPDNVGEVCHEKFCYNKLNCPKLEKGRKI